METTEALDHELIIERAEAIRLWLLGLHLSSRATSAIQRELGAIIDNDPGSYINGQRPLAGLTIANFVSELHQPNGGAIGLVKNVGFAALKELREKIPADAVITQAEPDLDDSLPEIDYTIPDLDMLPTPPTAAVAESAVAAAPAESDQAPRRRRGRPKGSKNIRRKSEPEDLPAAPLPIAAAPALIDTPAEPAAPIEPVAPADLAAPAADDRMLQQIARLWPSLHPQARRAVLTYASELWAEGGYKG